MLSFENFVKSMPPSLSEWKVTPSFCFAFKIPDDVTASNIYTVGQAEAACRTPLYYVVSMYLYIGQKYIWCVSKIVWVITDKHGSN